MTLEPPTTTARRDIGPTEQVLMTAVARRFYLHGHSKTEIADALGISRFKVARMLERALAEGLVRIEIDAPSEIDVDLSAAIIERFGLRHAVVVTSREVDETVLRRQVADAAADLLTEIVEPGSVLGVAWARSLSAMSAGLTRISTCEVVQLTGALQLPEVDENSIDLVREIARLGRGAAHYFHAPMIVDSGRTAAALRQQPEVARTLARIDAVDVAFVGVGGWSAGTSTVYDAVPAPEQADLHRLGVRAEISGVLIDEHGQHVPAALAERIVGITADQLRTIGTVVGIAYSLSKTEPVRAALRGGWLSGLITHDSLAVALLEGDDA